MCFPYSAALSNVIFSSCEVKLRAVPLLPSSAEQVPRKAVPLVVNVICMFC